MIIPGWTEVKSPEMKGYTRRHVEINNEWLLGTFE